MSKTIRIRFAIAAVINLAVFCIVVGCLFSLIDSYNNDNNRFIYFTNISNLLVGLISLANVIFLSLSIAKNKIYVRPVFSLIKVIALSMTTLTFFIVLFVIGPLDGYAKNYTGRNFFTHLVVPVLALISYLFFEEKLQSKWKTSILILIPLVIYSILYIVCAIVLHYWPDIYHINKQGLWYLFLLAFLIVDFGIGQGIYFLKKFIDSKSYK